jgi:hypothetical protein
MYVVQAVSGNDVRACFIVVDSLIKESLTTAAATANRIAARFEKYDMAWIRLSTFRLELVSVPSKKGQWD